MYNYGTPSEDQTHSSDLVVIDLQKLQNYFYFILLTERNHCNDEVLLRRQLHLPDDVRSKVSILDDAILFYCL